jgi:hypothetical protein
MKATVNIGTREVTIKYSIDKKSLIPMKLDSTNSFLMPSNDGDCGDWKTFQKTKNSKIQCTQSFSFKDTDEWLSLMLLDGRVIDFHYDYEMRSQFDNKKDWASYIFQGYPYTEGEPQLYDEQIVNKVVIEL